ncbi:MAG TPA: penicillin acylase family protein [Myxococcales bacterium]|nr:penicillin acylase family protein [Myxococcales bacterium]
MNSCTRVICVLLLLAFTNACSDSSDETETADVATTTGADEGSGGGSEIATGDDGSTGGSDTEEPISYEHPAYFPGAEQAADEVTVIDGLEGPVRVVWDSRGIPHIYGNSLADLAFAQGYVSGQLRLFQFHTLRMAASGRLAELLGVSSLKGDVLLRTLKLRHTAEKMAEMVKNDYPAEYALLEAYCAGVNRWIDKVNNGEVPKPQEVILFNLTLDHWTPADGMTIVRLQTWDLGFGNAVNEDSAAALVAELSEKWAGTALEGIAADALNYEPPAKTPTIPLAAQKPGTGVPFDMGKVLNSPFFKNIRASTFRRMANAESEMAGIPHHVFRTLDYGSNNWVVSGKHTASGKPIVSNDPHLSLRNPSVFYHVHLNNVAAGGDFEVNGVNFVGLPGIVLGNNRHAAWGATVFYSDVTDVYVEKFNEDKSAVWFKDAWVPVEKRSETFFFGKPKDGCEAGVQGWVQNLNPHVKELADGQCELTVTIDDVPHHGPMMPWGYDTDKDDNSIGMSWRWTGFEPTREFLAIWGLNSIKSPEDFKATLDQFDVGAQNWIYGDVNGNIAWYPSHQLPIRSHIAAGDTTYPPYLPMPGDGSAEWDGYLDRSKIPQSFNPESGFLVTANADPTGTSYDNNAFNDGPYIGFAWALGFRMERAHELVAGLVSKGGITPDDMKAVQADHRSPLGARVTPHLLAAIELAESGAAPQAAVYLNDRMLAAKKLLSAWSFNAASGVGAEAGTQVATDAAATAIYNAFQSYLVHNIFDDELGETGLGTALTIRLLIRMLEKPKTLSTFDSESGESRIWDIQGTKDRETKAQIMLGSLSQGLTFLAAADKVGPLASGGFGTDDMSQWRWGALHTLTLKNNLSNINNIPAPSELPGGFPRHGDNFCVDASHPGIGDQNFTFSGGPSMRHVFELTEPVVRYGALPGGQNESPFSPHYADEMRLWVENEAPVVPWQSSDVMADKEQISDLIPPSAVQ